jgi:hypothetical protein
VAKDEPIRPVTRACVEVVRAFVAGGVLGCKERIPRET